MNLNSKFTDYIAHIKGFALNNHMNSAHKGVFSDDCPACRELLEKQKILLADEPTKIKPIRINFRIPFNKGKNPTGSCKKSQHSECGGKHGRKHGLPGEPCTCECHLDKS